MVLFLQLMPQKICTAHSNGYKQYANVLGFLIDISIYIADVVRLRGGSTLREGRVEMIKNEIWVALNTYSWNQNGADVVCKQLGYSNGAEEVVTSNRYLLSFPRGTLLYEGCCC